MLKDRRTYEIMRPEDVGAAAHRARARQALRPPRAAPGRSRSWATPRRRRAEGAPSCASRSSPTARSRSRRRPRGDPRRPHRAARTAAASSRSRSRRAPAARRGRGSRSHDGADDAPLNGSAEGDGPVDATLGARQAAISRLELREYDVHAVIGGPDALGEVRLLVPTASRAFAGQAVATDIAEASARAYLRASRTPARPPRTPRPSRA